MHDIAHIFRTYDIRGIYGQDLNEEVMKRIGSAFSRFSKDAVVSRDMRVSSKALADSFISGFVKAGGKAEDAGLLPLGAAVFHGWRTGRTTAYITASHLPKEWNGAKFFHKDASGFLERENQEMRELVISGDFAKGSGNVKEISASMVVDDYIRYLSGKIRPSRKIRAALDFGNGAAALAAGKLFRSAGIETVEIFDELDGTFPSRDPGPQEDPLDALREAVIRNECDLGIAYDGDGDRMVLVDETGKKLTAEQSAYLMFSSLVLAESGPLAANIECSKVLDAIAEKAGRDIVRFPVGHTFLINETIRHKACLGVEVAGHYIIPGIVPFDDALAVSLYAAYALSRQDKPLSRVITDLPEYQIERLTIPCDDRKKFAMMKQLIESFRKKYKDMTMVDGVLVRTPEGSVLVRPSNTSPIIRVTIEADTAADLKKLSEEFIPAVRRHIEQI